MMNWMRLAVLGGCLFGFAAAAAAEDDLETVQRRIIEAWRKHKSLTANIVMSSRLQLGESVVDGMGTGTYEFLKQGDKLLSRLEIRSTLVQKQGTEERKIEQSMTSISDGDIAHTISEMGAEKTVIKTKVEPRQSGDPQRVFEFLARDSGLRLMPEDTLDGRKLYVIEVTPRRTAPLQPIKQLLSFDQESGFLMRIVGLGADDTPQASMTYKDVKIDAHIDPDHFKFQAPEGVEIIDETGATPPASGPASAPASQPSGAAKP